MQPVSVPEPEPARRPPGLLRRVVDGLRRPPPDAPPAARPPTQAPPPKPPPRATITRLVAPPTPAPAQPEPEPESEPAVSETPEIAGTSAQRLARVLGTEVGIDEQGNATVEMPGAPFVPFSTAPRTVSRSAASETHRRAREPDAASRPAAPTPAEVDVDAIAETVIDKLRRELLIEREQAGGPMDLI